MKSAFSIMLKKSGFQAERNQVNPASIEEILDLKSIILTPNLILQFSEENCVLAGLTIRNES